MEVHEAPPIHLVLTFEHIPPTSKVLIHRTLFPNEEVQDRLYHAR